jgi:hypothetical protein
VKTRDFKIGQVYVEYSKQFDSLNVMKITGVYRNKIRSIFVNESDFNQKRLSDDREFTTWDFSLDNQKYLLIGDLNE